MSTQLIAAPDDALIELDAVAGRMRAILALPQGTAPARAVVLFPHVGGLTTTMQAMANRVAALGYACIVPDLYHRLGRIVLDPQSEDAQAIQIRGIAATSITAQSAMEDLDAVLLWADTQPRIASPVVATLGFGRGGSLALLAAGHSPRIKAVASILGFGFSGDHTAALTALRHRGGDAYFAFAENDDIIPATEPRKVAALLADAGLDARLIVHSGTRHPYVFPDRTVFDAAAANKDWAAVTALFSNQL